MFRFLDKRFYREPGVELRPPGVRLRAHRAEPELHRREDQGEAPTGPRGARRPRLPGADEPRRALSKVGRGEWKIALVRQSNPVEEKPRTPASRLRTGTHGLGERADRPGCDPRHRRRAGAGLSRGADRRPGRSPGLAFPAAPEEGRRPGRLLVDAIRKDYAAPKGFEAQAARVKREEAERERQRQEAEAKRRQKEEQARERAEQAQGDEVLELAGRPGAGAAGGRRLGAGRGVARQVLSGDAGEQQPTGGILLPDHPRRLYQDDLEPAARHDPSSSGGRGPPGAAGRPAARGLAASRPGLVLLLLGSPFLACPGRRSSRRRRPRRA